MITSGARVSVRLKVFYSAADQQQRARILLEASLVESARLQRRLVTLPQSTARTQPYGTSLPTLIELAAFFAECQAQTSLVKIGGWRKDDISTDLFPCKLLDRGYIPEPEYSETSNSIPAVQLKRQSIIQ